jgi:hypothetical protein
MPSDTFLPGPLAEIVHKTRTGREPGMIVRKKKTGEGHPERYVFVLINISSILAGDRILLRAASGIELTVKGPVARCSSNGSDVLYIYRDGTLRIAVSGKPRASLTTAISLPKVPQPATRVLGPLMPHLCVPEHLKRHPLDSYFVALDRLVIANDLNYLSLCPIACWSDLDIGSPFVLTRGKRDLSEIDPLFEGAFSCLFWRAARAGVAVHLYPFEFVSFNHADFWNRSPLNAANNIHGWIDSSQPLAYKGFHGIIKDGDPAGARDILYSYFRRLCGMIDPRQAVSGLTCHAVGRACHAHSVIPVLEGQSRTVDINLAAHRRGRPLGINQKALYQDSAWSASGGMNEHLSKDPAWRGLLSDVSASGGFVSCHSCDSNGVTKRILGRLLPFASEFGFALLASTDGTGAGCGELSRYRRPRGTRPNLDDLTNIWREGLETAVPPSAGFLGLEIKTTSWDDALEILPAVAERIL